MVCFYLFIASGYLVINAFRIIVGVKYCFRYNQRNRALRAHADGDPIDLTAMPRPHRRRREKKLMTMDEVNSRFPLIKYKAWRASREHQGLPAAGGITAPPSRAGSIKDVEGTIDESPKRMSVDQDRPGSSLSHINRTIPASPTHPTIAEVAATPNEKTIIETIDDGKDNNRDSVVATKTRAIETADDEMSDDEDPIADAAVPEEILNAPGDTCAICLDTLEDDEDVRGLTCGHAFHAACVDPWLSGRRACCPLCKADYYVPKPRPEGEANAESAGRRSGHPLRLNMPQAPQTTWLGGRYMPARSRMIILSSNRGMGDPAMSRTRSQHRSARPAPAEVTNETPATAPSPAPGWRSRLPTSIPNPFRRRPNDAAQTNPSPGQLEAATR
jgi:Ring finger domain